MGASVFLCSVATLLALSLTCVVSDTVDRDHLAIDRDAFMRLLGRVEHLEKRDQEQQAEIEKLRDELYTDKHTHHELCDEQQKEIHSLRDELIMEKQRTSLMEDRLSRLVDTSIENRPRKDDTKMQNDDTADESIIAKTAPEDALTSAWDTAVFAEQESRHASGEGTMRGTLPDKTKGDQTGNTRRQAETPVIAFHASLTNTSQHTGTHQSITFDNIVTNIGAAYNPHVGAFIAPVAGVYVFHTTIVIHYHHDTHASIVKNGVHIVNMYIRGIESAWGSDTAVAVLYLKQGDDVSVQNNDPDKDIEGNHFTMFSGFLLRQDDPDFSIVGK